MNRASMTSEKSQTKNKIYPKNWFKRATANGIALFFHLKIPAKIAQSHWLLPVPLKNQNKAMWKMSTDKRFKKVDKKYRLYDFG